jgi:hypothetical protein
MRGRTVVLATTAYRSATIRWARFTTMTAEGVEIGNVVVLPAPARRMPILGCDWVSVTPTRAMMAFDLSPTVPNVMHPELAAWRAARANLIQAEGLPAFCSRFFSPHSLFTRVGPESAGELVSAFQDGAALFAHLASHAALDETTKDEAARTLDAYNRAHREDDPSMDMLHHTFGRPWSERFLREVMFPDVASS